MYSVIFDMDGTLIDTQKTYVDGWEYAGNKQGIKGMGACITKVCGMNEEGWSRYLEENYKDLDIVTFKKTVNNYFAEHGESRFKKGAIELIDFLKERNIKIAVASGSPTDAIIEHLTKLKALDKFDVMVGGKDVENGKPAPDVYLLACKKLGANPEECFAFEDSPNGIKSAYAAGTKCIGVPDVAPFGEDIKKMLFKELPCLSDAIEIFKNM